MQDDTKQIVPEEETIAKYTIKDSVFSDFLRLKNICCNYTEHSTQKIKFACQGKGGCVNYDAFV